MYIHYIHIFKKANIFKNFLKKIPIHNPTFFHTIKEIIIKNATKFPIKEKIYKKIL